MVGKMLRGRASRAMVVVAVLGALAAVSSGTPTSAAVSKTLTGSCAGADGPSQSLLAAFGGSLSVPFVVTSNVPATLDPEAPDQPISFTWGVTLAASVTTQVAAIDPTLTIKDSILDMGVSGPTATKEVQGRPPAQDIAITAGQPATVNQGPFNGTLTEIGKGGIIKYSPKAISFTISIDISGKATDVKVACQAPGTVATTSIKIPGSPDIVQPIEVTNATPNSTVTVDVLGKFVTPGTDEKGVKRPVLPETLKVVEGPGTVAGGQVQVQAGAAGSTASVTFEVCSGTLPGTNEVQTLVLDTSSEVLKKGIGFTLKYGDAKTQTIWMVSPGWRVLFPDLFQEPTNWPEQANSYILTPWELPSAAEIQLALERVPAIGGGGVKVTNTPDKPGAYSIEFTGKNGEKDVDQIALGSYYSVFPQEVLASIIAAAQSLLGGSGGDGTTTTTTLPGGLSLDEYVAKLEADLAAAQAAGDLALSLQILGELIPLKLQQGLANIDVNEAIGFLTSLFSKSPELATGTAGDLPIGICSQGVIDVTAAGAGTSAANVAGTSATKPGAGLAFTG